MPYKTPTKRALGLGSAKSGTHHWWMQRVSAVAMVILVLWFAFSAAVIAGSGHAEVVAWIGSPVVAGMLILLIATLYFHAQLGLQVVIEDYVPHHGLQLAGVYAVKFLAIILALTGILAVLRIALGG